MSYIINLMTITLNYFYNIKGTEIVGQHAQVVLFMPTDMVNVAAEGIIQRKSGITQLNTMYDRYIFITHY